MIVHIERTSAKPVHQRPGVEQRLDGTEALARDDEHRAPRVEDAAEPFDLNAVDPGHEMHPQVVRSTFAESITKQTTAEVRSADADVDDIRDRFAGAALHCAGMKRLRHRSHALASGQDRPRDGISEVARFTSAQRNVQRGAFLGSIDDLSREHGVALLLDAAGTGKGVQPAHGFLGQAKPISVELNSASGCGRVLAITQVAASAQRLKDVGRQRAELLPFWRLAWKA